MSKKISFIITTVLLLLICVQTKTHAQFVIIKEVQYPAYLDGKDTVAIVALPEIVIFPPMVYLSQRDKDNFNRLVRDVKRTLPYAKMIYATLIETYEYMQTLPNDKAREAHMKRMEKELYAQYKPQLKKLSLRQGKLLIKLVSRECNQSSYNLVKAYFGTFRAGFWNIFAHLFGASLTSVYEPYGADSVTERVVILVERGLI